MDEWTYKCMEDEWINSWIHEFVDDEWVGG